MSNLYIKPEYKQILIDIFNSYCPNAIIWVYGSRLKGNCHEGSDLDLSVIDFKDFNKSISELKEFLVNSNIPFLIDINEYKYLPESFKQEILKNYEVIFPAGGIR